MTLHDILIDLTNAGCYPGLYYRGDCWRAHVNCAGNYWHDDKRPLKAMMTAVALWKKAGKPMDGMAAEAAKDKR